MNIFYLFSFVPFWVWLSVSALSSSTQFKACLSVMLLLARIFLVQPLVSGKPYTMRLKHFICKNLLYNTEEEEDEDKDNYGIWVFAQIVSYFKENHFVFFPKRF